MTTTTTIESTPAIVASAPVERRLKIDGSDPLYGDFRDDLVRDGYAIIKGAIPSEKLGSYADRMYSLLEGL